MSTSTGSDIVVAFANVPIVAVQVQMPNGILTARIEVYG